jgi:hypothetical protein
VIPLTVRGVIPLRTPMPKVSFRATLKPLEVEEIIDLVFHRPLAWLITRAVYKTRVQPDQITWASMFVGIAAGIVTWSSFVYGAPHLVLGGGLFIFSAVLDCSDGQLARLRETSSAFGRMLDGAVDAVVQAAVVPAVMAHVWWQQGGASVAPPYNGSSSVVPALWWLLAGVGAIVSGLAHTVLYDHYKNVYLHHIQVVRKEGDDPEDLRAAEATLRARKTSLSDLMRIHIAVPYLINQRRWLLWMDPYVPARFRDMAVYSEDTAARYRASQRTLMRLWSFYGIGTHIFGLGLAMALNAIETYLLVRLVVFNLVLVPLVMVQRRASKTFFETHI